MTSPPLNDADKAILGELDEGRVTAAFLATRIDWSREYITQRLRRLEEHGIVENLGDTGLYELADAFEQPRNGKRS
ncbi:winged helix-turn-helix transcriptional regulator [Haloplanus sp. C73]|uniref:winged helix-turn-helix transcriptional regulator n=1 Tax=Haloplanus sp. C73 TaxID=3421641 RepID=UPI003EBD55E8